jgi:hypothetical protein
MVETDERTAEAAGSGSVPLATPTASGRARQSSRSTRAILISSKVNRRSCLFKAFSSGYRDR